jgi:Polyketide cyclase / dehydrase and lipid transport
MPEVTYTTTMNLPVTVVWDFVKDMNNWAPFLTGYQQHEILSETDSIWTLKGDVGILSRTVKLKAHVTEWSGPERVSFTLTGMNEQVEGGGKLVMSPHLGQAPAPPKLGIVRRLVNGLFRLMMRFFNRERTVRRELPAASGDGSGSLLSFTLRMEATGATGPLVNAMLEPALLPAAEDLANKIAAHLEERQRLPA